MSNKENKSNEIHGVRPSKPEGVIHGVQTGDDGATKGSYVPTSEAPPPPPPKKK